MNLSKRCSMIITFSRLFKMGATSNACLCQKYCSMSSSKLQLSEVIQPNPFKIFNYYLCTKNDNRCWSCGSSVSSLFCTNCKSLQRVNKDKNYFELLGLDYNYDIKLQDLTKKYRQLQSVLHPDKFGNKSEEEKLISEEYSSVINKAYSTLSHPIERGLYMLKIVGVTIEEGTVQLDPTFLIEIMDRNEEIEDEKDGNKLSEYNTINKESMNTLIRELITAFQKDDKVTAKEVLTKLKYYSSIDSKIKQIKQNLGIPD